MLTGLLSLSFVEVWHNWPVFVHLSSSPSRILGTIADWDHRKPEGFLSMIQITHNIHLRDQSLPAIDCTGADNHNWMTQNMQQKLKIFKTHNFHRKQTGSNSTSLETHRPPMHWRQTHNRHKSVFIRPCETRPYILLECFLLLCECFLTPELMDWDRLDRRPSFLCHRWGPWLKSKNKSIEIPPTSPPFLKGAKSTKFWYHSCPERHHFELKDFFKNLKKLVK